MSPAPPQRQSMAASLLPLVSAVCVVVLARQGFERFAPDLSWWISFLCSLAAGYLAYYLVERFMRRRRPGGRAPQDSPTDDRKDGSSGT